MRALFIGCALSGLLGAQAPTIPQVEAKDLKAVPGPMTGTRPLRDLAGSMGNSRMDLEMRRSARGVGTVPALAVPAGNLTVASQVFFPAGWQAFRVETAPGEKVKARLRGDHEAWFVVHCVNRNGNLEEGMLQNMIPTGNPEASYLNPGRAAATVYFVVDTSELISGGEPFTITFTRELR